MLKRICVTAWPLILWTTAVATPAARQDPPKITFHKDVLPIVQKSCQSCHRPGQIGPFSMLTYKEARPWAKAIKAAVASRRMPPWNADPRYGHFTNDRSLSPSEIETLMAWADSGGMEGDPKDAPPPVNWPAGGWQIAPDVTFNLPAYDVPATGVLEWETIAFPAPFAEDTWVTSVEILPGAPEVVHHLCMGFKNHRPTTLHGVYEWMDIPRDEKGVAVRGERPKFVITREVGSTELKRREGRPVIPSAGNDQFCYLPGTPPEDYRALNAGVLVPTGSDVVFTIHYNATGLAVTDRTRVGFTVASKPPAKRFLPQSGDESGRDGPVARESRIQGLAIPPYEADYVAPVSVTTFLEDVELAWFRPHAHQRGKSVQYKFVFPDGREEILLSVPKFDFNWQLTYKTSRRIPKGTRMETHWRYDNSVRNRYNPDPSQWVYYGDQSWEEMGGSTIGFVVERGDGTN